MRDVEGSYRALLAVTNVLNSQRDTDSLWRAITGQIRQVLPWERAGITLYNPDTDSFRFYAVETSMPNRQLQRDAVIPKVGSAVGWVHDHRTIHVRPDLQRERIFLEDEYYVRQGLGRMINSPLLVGDSCIGTLNIGSVQHGEPDPADLEFLQLVATQIAYAIDHVRAYEQIDQLRQQLARENEYLVEELKSTHNFGAMIGVSGVFRKALVQAQAVGTTSLPLLRLDMGRVFGGIVGQSEANLRSVIQTAEAIAPCVLWIDEIEKGFGLSTMRERAETYGWNFFS